jgi:hypothetical protein
VLLERVKNGKLNGVVTELLEVGTLKTLMQHEEQQPEVLSLALY